MRRTFPMQPVVIASDGVARFQANRIIEDLWRTGAISMNAVAIAAAEGKYTDAEQMQLAQLIGYSVSGFGELSYADKATIRRADGKVAKLLITDTSQ